MRTHLLFGLLASVLAAPCAASAVERSIDGSALADATASREQSESAALDAITRALANYPQSIFAIQLGDPKVETENGKTYLGIPIEVTTDLQAYERVAHELERGLSEALPKPLEFETSKGHEIYFSESPATPPLLVVATEIAPDHSRMKWKAFAIPEKVEGWLKGHQRPFVPPVRITLKDGDSTVIWSTVRRLKGDEGNRGFICRSKGGGGISEQATSDRFYVIAPFTECQIDVSRGVDTMYMAVLQGMVNQMRDGQVTRGEQGDEQEMKQRVASSGKAAFSMNGEIFGFKGVLKADVPAAEMARVKSLSGNFADPKGPIDEDE